jgi:hypothetical protein
MAPETLPKPEGFGFFFFPLDDFELLRISLSSSFAK